jgi:hypothetical protein
VWLGAPVVKAIVADRVAPGVLGRVLASRGYDAQQTNEPEDPQRPDNLWEPAPGAFAAHGRFDAQARESSLEFWMARNKSIVIGALALIAAAGIAWRRDSDVLSATNRPEREASDTEAHERDSGDWDSSATRESDLPQSKDKATG